MAIDNLGSPFCYQETGDEMIQKVQCLASQLQSAKLQANEEIRRNRENINQLLLLLQIAYKERDEARDQLQTLLRNKLLLSSPSSTSSPGNPTTHSPPESTLIMMIPNNHPPGSKSANNSSSIESSSDDIPNNNINHRFSPISTSPVDDILSPLDDVISSSSPTGSNNNISPLPNNSLSPPFVPTAQVSPPPTHPCVDTKQITTTTVNSDEMFIISSMAKGKPLPEKGRLLQAVMDAGPLLQTLMVAGPLPQWKNPPPIKPLQVAPPHIPMLTTTTTPTTATLGNNGHNNNNNMVLNGMVTSSSPNSTTSDIFSSGCSWQQQGYSNPTCAASTLVYGSDANTSSVVNLNSGGSGGLSGIYGNGGVFGSSSANTGCFGNQFPVTKRHRTY